ncbi:MAG: hypothetical protein IJA34_06560 [Lachnospiraceae bacterium]|nr:hypothetical protein [Lachnospiraceae bacterium]
MKKECLTYLELVQSELNEEFPKYETVIKELFIQVSDFMNNDFDGISENRIYRLFLDKLKDITRYAFDSDVSKAYMRSFFARLNNKEVVEYLTGIMKTKSIDIINIMKRFVNFFVYWQDSDNAKEKKLEEIIKLVDGWM